MRGFTLVVLTVTAACGLAGCVRTVYLTGRSAGLAARTTIPAGRPSGDITIAIGSKVFVGHYTVVATDGGVGFSVGTAFSGARSATVTSAMFVAPTHGNGTLTAAAGDGTSLRCIFDWSQISVTGIGQCQDSAGETYDMRIN